MYLAMRITAALLGMLSVALIAGCGMLAPAPTTYDEIAATCPSDPSAEVVERDGSSSRDDLVESDLAVIRDRAMRAAVCNGRLTVSTFSADATTDQVHFDGYLELEGATDIARARHLDEVVDAAMTSITADIEQTVTPAKGTDVVASLDQLVNVASQLPADMSVTATILTDGLNTEGVSFKRALRRGELARELKSLAVPSFGSSVVSLTFVGVGDDVSGALTAVQLRELRAAYVEIGERAGVDSVTVVTEYVSAW